jgi:hypothetical protein
MPNSDETYDRRLIDTSDGINGNAHPGHPPLSRPQWSPRRTLGFFMSRWRILTSQTFPLPVPGEDGYEGLAKRAD